MVNLVQGNALSIPLADKSVQCIITSPPYWGLRAYATGDNKHVELGSEPLHDCLGWATGNDCGECYLCHMRQVARECWRVLRDDGVMFWNIADSYAGNGNMTPHSGLKLAAEKWDGRPRQHNAGDEGKYAFEANKKIPPGLKPKDKCGIPERTALAFQADGWYWRSGITWVKPNPMPESVTDRPTKSTEMVYLFTKAERYYWDAEAVREEAILGFRQSEGGFRGGGSYINNRSFDNSAIVEPAKPPLGYDKAAGRNLRDAWTIATAPYPGQHFATFPPELPRRCIKVGTSERGACPKCGKAWVRITDNSEKTPDLRWAPSGGLHRANTPGQETSPSSIFRTGQQTITKTLGWRAACACGAGDPRPCIVLDPFSGAATTGLVARELNRHYVGLELSWEYLKQSRDRLLLEALNAWSGNGKAKEADLSDLPMFARDE